MDSSLTFYLILGALLLGFIVLGMLKGMIKMLLFGAAVLSSVAAYFWLWQRQRGKCHHCQGGGNRPAGGCRVQRRQAAG